MSRSSLVSGFLEIIDNILRILFIFNENHRSSVISDELDWS